MMIYKNDMNIIHCICYTKLTFSRRIFYLTNANFHLMNVILEYHEL